MRASPTRHPAERARAPIVLAASLAASLMAACAGPATSSSASNGVAPDSLAVELEASGPLDESLRVLLGTFEVDCLWWPTVGADPIASRGVLHTYWDATAEVLVCEFDGDPRSEHLASLMRIGWDAVRECYVSDWWDASGDLLLPLADGHTQPEGTLVFARGSSAASSIQVLTVLGEDQHRIELSSRGAVREIAPDPVLLLNCRRRDPVQ